MGPRAHLEWGVSGAKRAAARGDVAIIVDVLRFSSVVVAACATGALVFPYRGRNAAAFAAEAGAELARGNSRYSLSPASFEGAPAGVKVVLPSANGSTVTWFAARSAPVLAGALLNATSVARAASGLAEERDSGLTVIACGERPTQRWEEERSYEFRPAIEDWLGAGAILSALGCNLSAEALLAEAAYNAAGDSLLDLLTRSESGIELQGMGLTADVEFCARVDAYDIAPMLIDGAFQEASLTAQRP